MPTNQSTARPSGRSPRARVVAVAVAVAVAIPGPPASAGTIVVGPRGNVATLADAVRRARPGDTIRLPPGTFPAGVTLPPEVGLRGEGYDRTILEAGGRDDGLVLAGGRGVEVADLTVRNAPRTGILVVDARDAAIRRVRVTGCNDGIRLVRVTRGRVENAVVADNRFGIILDGGRDNAVVNCTIARNDDFGLGIPDGTGATAFNNAIVGAATGVLVGEEASGLRLDHNLDFNLCQGKIAGQAGRRMLGAWRSSSGLDARSVRLPLDFRDPDAGDFRPDGTLAWALDRASTSDWGVSALAGILAPKRDIEGNPRIGPPDVGAFETRPAPDRPADGVVTVRSEQGAASAGIFRVDGVEVAYLFHDLPLTAGEHPFWFPTRDVLGRPIAPGRYDLRTVEGSPTWQPLGPVGDVDEVVPPDRGGSSYLAFDDDGHLIVGRGWTGSEEIVRGYDGATGRPLWTSRGSSRSTGLAAGRDGALYVLRASDDAGAGVGELIRLDPRSGKVAPRAGMEAGRIPLDLAAGAAGMAELDGRLFVADAKADCVRFGPAGAGDLAGSLELPAPSSPVADPKGGVVWVISEGRRLVAIGPDGRLAAEATPLPAPTALAARDGVLAVASRQTGKVHRFDASDPKDLKPLSALGRGDGPYGPYLPDRFLFQDDPSGHVALALGPHGRLAVLDRDRRLVFDGEDRLLWSTFGFDGRDAVPSQADPRRTYDADGRRTIQLDESSGTWRPDTAFDVPVTGKFAGDFSDGDRTFGLFLTGDGPGFDPLVVRFDGPHARPVLGLVRDATTGGLLVRKDRNKDGRLDAGDVGTPMLGRDGRPIVAPLFGRATHAGPGGGLVVCAPGPGPGVAFSWPRRGLDGDGVPVYRAEDRVPLTVDGKTPWISPYTFGPEPSARVVSASRDAAGGIVANLSMSTSPRAGGLIRDAGTDLAGFDAEGQFRWSRPFPEPGGVGGLSTVGSLTIAGAAGTGEVLVLDGDGLGLGGFGPPSRAHDRDRGNPLAPPGTVRLYRGRDRRAYALIADRSRGRLHWFRLDGEERIKAATSTATLGDESARALATRPAAAPRLDTPPAPRPVRIPRLVAPWTVDGDPRKWRREGIRPQVVIIPEDASGRLGGPFDCCAVVRLAYHDQDLYAQFLVFDDVASFPRSYARSLGQDGVAIRLGSPPGGFRFNVTTTGDSGPWMLRDRPGSPTLTRPIAPERAPRVVRVLDDARDVPERTLIEGPYGVDLSRDKVIITELRLPIGEAAYQDAPESLKEVAPLEPGRRFRLGLLVRDNDEPGTDLPDTLAWPATSREPDPPGSGAQAVLD